MNEVFVSTAIYGLARQMGLRDALIEFQRQLMAPAVSSLPVIHSILRLRELADIQLGIESGATIIGQMRSRAFHAAYESGSDAWISLDDDIEASAETCSHVLDAIDDRFLPRIVIVPYLIRTADGLPDRACVTLPLVRSTREIARTYGARLKPAKLVTLLPGMGAGFGMVGMNRLAMACIVKRYDPPLDSEEEDLRWIDGQDGVQKLALFHDMLITGLWYGEDTSFFRRVPSSVSVEALLTGNIAHAGVGLDLETL